MRVRRATFGRNGISPGGRRASRPLLKLLPGVLCLAACASRSAALPPAQPFVVVLGVAQDGGLPHVGCHRRRCEAARRDPRRRRRVACLGLVTAGHVFLFDATPDFPAQAAALARWRRPDAPPRRPVDGILLTHAHLGHYLGLAHLGREAAGARDVPVWCTERMARFLRTNAPWDLLVRLGNVELRPLTGPVRLPGGVTVTALPVPHRGEYTDTVAYRIEGPRRRVLYLPDIDAWAAWDRDLAQVLAAVDRAYLDGTFFSDGELPERNLAEVPHPRVTRTLAALRRLPRSARRKVRFLHLNHTNPLWDAGSAARRQVTAVGAGVAVRGERFAL